MPRTGSTTLRFQDGRWPPTYLPLAFPASEKLSIRSAGVSGIFSIRWVTLSRIGEKRRRESLHFRSKQVSHRPMTGGATIFSKRIAWCHLRGDPTHRRSERLLKEAELQ